MEDVLIIGAGPAGLSAALYLARYRRKVRVVHDGRSRALLAPMAHNVPGFPDGVAGHILVAAMTAHASRYGASVIEGRVTGLSRRDDRGNFVAALEDGTHVEARGVILATGVVTNEAILDKELHDAAVRAGTLRYCPICDGFEHSGADIAVLGSDLHGAAEAMFLRQYSDRVTLIPKWRVALTDTQRRELDESDVKVLEQEVVRLDPRKDAMLVHLAGDPEPRQFDVLYPALGSQPRVELALGLGLQTDEEGGLDATAFATPLLPGLFAAGDVLTGLDQISVATGQGATAATRLHNWLREQEGHVMADQQ